MDDHCGQIASGDQWLQGSPEVWAASSPIPLDLHFLQSVEGERLSLRALYAEVVLTTTVAAGDAWLRRGYYGVAERIYLRDDTGERTDIQLGGDNMLLLGQQIWGPEALFLPSDLAAGASQVVRYLIPIWSEWPAARDSAETRIWLSDLTSASCVVTTGAALIGTGTTHRMTTQSATIRPVAIVVDEGGAAHDKMRLRYKNFPLTRTEDTYSQIPPGSRVLFLGVANGDVNWKANAALPTAWAAAQRISSTSIRMQDLLMEDLITEYGRRHSGALALGRATGDSAVRDACLQGNVIPLYRMQEGQSVLETPMMGRAIHYRTDAASITTGDRPCILSVFIEPRAPCELAGKVVVTSEGVPVPAGRVSTKVASILPTQPIAGAAAVKE